MAAEKNTVIRRPTPIHSTSPDGAPRSRGQGLYTAISARTGWEYEHDETDEQIDAIEEMIAKIRDEEGVSVANNGKDASGLPLRGATFSWNVDEDGNVVIGTTYVEDGDGVVSVGSRQIEGKVWVAETWVISPDGKVKGG